MTDLFADQPVAVEEMLACARRELAMRERVYPRWVAGGKMTRDKADQELRVMGAIVRHLEAMAKPVPSPRRG